MWHILMVLYFKIIINIIIKRIISKLYCIVILPDIVGMKQIKTRMVKHKNLNSRKWSEEEG